MEELSRHIPISTCCTTHHVALCGGAVFVYKKLQERTVSERIFIPLYEQGFDQCLLPAQFY